MRTFLRPPSALAITASLALVSCAGAKDVATPVHELVAAPPAPDPKCDVAATERARVPGLLAQGRIGRTVRVLERADALCPKTAPETWGALVTTLAELGRDEEAQQLARIIAGSPVADAASREAAEQARLVVAARSVKGPADAAASARAFASAAQARAKGQLADAKRLFIDAWHWDYPNGAALAWAGMATKELGDVVEAQRLFDRAIVELEGAAGATDEPPSDASDASGPWGRPRSPGSRKPDKHEKDPNGIDWDLFSFSIQACDPICRDGEDRAGDAARPRHPKVVVQVPNAAAAEGLAWSPDGRWLAVVQGRAVSIRDRLLDGRETLRLDGHTKDITTVAFSPDGATVATGSGDKTIRLWGVATGEELRRLQGHGERVESLVFSADGETIFSGASDRSARLWSTRTGEETGTLEVALEDVLAVAVSPDGNAVAFASADDSVRLWSVEARRELRKLAAPGASMHRLAFSPDGRVLATSAADGKVLLWDVATGALRRRVAPLGKPPEEPSAPPIAFSPDSTKLAVGGPISFVVGVAAAGPRLELEGPGDVLSFAFSPDGQSLTSGALDGALRTYQVPTPSPGAKAPRAPTTVRGGGGPASLALSVAFSPDGKTLAAGSWDDGVRLFRAGPRPASRALRGHVDAVFAVAFSPDGRTLVSGSRDRTLRLFDVGAGTETLELEGHGGTVWSVAFSPDGQTIASGSKDATVRLWSVATGSEARKLEGHTSSVTSVAFSRDGKTVASGAEDGTLRLWSATSAEAPRTLEGHSSHVSDLAFSPDGTLLASASKDATVRLWKLASATEWRKVALRGDSQEVFSVAFSPDGGTLAWGMNDETVRLAPVATLGGIPAPIAIEGPSGHVSPVAFSPDGRVLVARSEEAVVMWTPDGRPLATVGAVSGSDAGFVLGPGAAPLLEILGPDVAAATTFPVCRSGARVFPFELCRERFEVEGMFARALGGEPTIDQP